MKLLDDIIELATDDKESLSNLLRKCLVLARRLKNKKLQEWVEKELDGYQEDDDLPDYRQTAAHARGFLLGSFGRQLNNQPLSPHVLDKDDQHWAMQATLTSAVSYYEELLSGDSGTNPRIPWPAYLVAKYQSCFAQGWALNRAWLEIPRPFITALLDSVRNRILRFSLEIQDELGEVDEKPERLEPKKVDQQVTNIIYGGNNIIGNTADQIVQNINQSVIENNIASLVKAFQELGFTKAHTDELTKAIEQDKKGFGQKTKDWLKSLPSKAVSSGAKVTGDIAVKVGTELLLQYFGIPRP